MLKKVSRLFVIKTRFEALAVIHALALGAVERGYHYLNQYPGVFGYLLFGACSITVLMAGAKLLDAVTPARAAGGPPTSGERRRHGRRAEDRRQAETARPA